MMHIIRQHFGDQDIIGMVRIIRVRPIGGTIVVEHVPMHRLDGMITTSMGEENCEGLGPDCGNTALAVTTVGGGPAVTHVDIAMDV